MHQLAKSVYEKQGKGAYSPELVQATADELTNAISDGYGDINADWDTPDHKMLEKLVEQVYSFSGAKNYQQLQDLTLLLKDEKGQLREFGDYRIEVDKIGHKYNRDWLQTEYQTAVASATTSARWVDYQEEAEMFPYLMYQTVGDDRVRNDHRLLNGTVKHINDAFWKTYYPPNGWNCRCEAIQMPDSDAHETNTPAYLPQVSPMFKTNLAENGLLFPKNHPYYTDVPKDVIRRSMQYLPEDYAFRTMQGYEEHAILQHEAEAESNRAIAQALAKSGEKDIKLMPRLHEKETELRDKYYGKEYTDAHPTKCADCFIGGEPVEFKEAGKNNMSKRIAQAAKQADTVALKTKEVLTEDYIERFVKGQWKHEDRMNLKQIIIINNGEVRKFDRP